MKTETKPEMKAEEAKREFQRKYAAKTYRLNPETLQREQTGYDINFMLDLNALLDEHYVEREKYERVLNQLAIHEEDCGVDDD